VQTINHSAISAEDLEELTNAPLGLPSNAATNTLLSVVDELRLSSVTFFSELDEVTPNQAAPLLGMSRPMVYRLLDSGELPARTIGRRARRIPMSAIRRYLERLERTAA
jgi:excisionase family DNA binding protein